MPLMSPNVQALLRKSGIQGLPPEKEQGEERTPLQDKMELAGLGLESQLENLSNIASNSTSDALRLRATETALKMHGALKESASNTTAAPSFTLVIQEGGQALVEGVNPIFLPRQLLSKLKDPAAVQKEPLVQ